MALKCIPCALLHLLRTALHEKVCITVHTQSPALGSTLAWGRHLPKLFEGGSGLFNLSDFTYWGGKGKNITEAAEVKH